MEPSFRLYRASPRKPKRFVVRFRGMKGVLTRMISKLQVICKPCKHVFHVEVRWIATEDFDIWENGNNYVAQVVSNKKWLTLEEGQDVRSLEIIRHFEEREGEDIKLIGESWTG